MPLLAHVLAAGMSLVASLVHPGAGGSSAPAPADPAPAPVWLRWTRGAGADRCVDAATFAARVDTELGPVVRRAAAGDRPRVAVSIGRGAARDGAPRWSADLRLIANDGKTTGSRHLERAGDTCDVLTDGLALMVALLLAGDARPSPPPSPTTPATVVAAANAPPVATTVQAAPSGPTATAGPRAAPVPRAPWTFAVEGGPLAGVGVLPDLAAAAEVRLWATPGRGPGLFLSGNWWRSQRTRIGEVSGAALDLWTVGLGVCPLAPRRAARGFVACVVGDVGRMGAAGFGFGSAFTVHRWTGDLGVEADVRQRVGRWAFVSVGIRGATPLTRDRVTYQDSVGTTRSVYRGPPVIAIAGLRVGAAFP